MSTRLQEPKTTQQATQTSLSIPTLKGYYESLWQFHCNGASRDCIVPYELITYFALPTIVEADRCTLCNTPFSPSNRCYILTAASGYGKSTLIDMILLSSIFPHLMSINSEFISPESKSLNKVYDKYKKALLGDISYDYIPVYINSYAVTKTRALPDMADSSKEDTIVCLAEGFSNFDFANILSYAESKAQLLFLIEALDEVGKDNLELYISAIEKLLRKYPNSRSIITTRSLGNCLLPFEHVPLFLFELSDDAIRHISHAITNGQSFQVMETLEKKPWAKKLVRNPFMLQSYLKVWASGLSASDFLSVVINDIIKRRWRIDNFNAISNTENVKILLGFLACHYVFGHPTEKNAAFVHQTLRNAITQLEPYRGLLTASINDADEFMKVLPIKSGIMNIVRGTNSDEYEFQEELIMQWLSANCLSRIISHIFDGDPLVLLDCFKAIDRFFRELIDSDDLFPTSNAVNAILFSITLLNAQQNKSILLYIIQRYLTGGLNEGDKARVMELFEHIINESYGKCGIEPHLMAIIRSLYEYDAKQNAQPTEEGKSS